MRHIQHRLRNIEARTLAQDSAVKGAYIVCQDEDDPKSIAAAKQQIAAIREQDSAALIIVETIVSARHADQQAASEKMP
jgi:hypothetical protein